MKRSCIVVAGLVVGACVWSRPARACSQDLSLGRLFPLPDHGQTDVDVPANRIFVVLDEESVAEQWLGWPGGVPPVVLDEDLTLHLAAALADSQGFADETLEVYRLAEPEAAIGATVAGRRCFDDFPCSFVVGERDDEPPSRPLVSNLAVEIWRNEGPSLYGCSNVDTMELDLEATDDRTAAQDLRYLAYFGDDEEEALTVEHPGAVWQPWSQFLSPPRETIFLGFGGGERDGIHFRRRGRFCFAISAADLAGNESERSEPTCIDTLDADDPRVSHASGCQCSTGEGGAPWGLAAMVLLGLVRRRRGRHLWT